MSKSTSSLLSPHIITTGLAMFSMFFGAGNVVFPLIVGQMAGSLVWYSIMGFMLTAVGVPFMGLIAMTLFNGNYRDFFNRIGRVPGYLATLFIMVLIGPINAIPRCISLSYGTIQFYMPNLSQFWFSIIACVIIFLTTYRKSKVADLLGQLLSPLLLVSLAVIAVKGLWSHPEAIVTQGAPLTLFWTGLYKGYNTMDLLGTFFFAGIAIASLRHHFPHEKQPTVMAKYAMQASFIGALLLGLVYVGFALLASYHAHGLAGLAPEVLLGTLAERILGGVGGIVVSIAVALACLTTALSLAAVFAEFLQHRVFGAKVSYVYCLVLTLVATAAFANLGFSQIVGMIEPVLIMGYPALMALTFFNALHEWRGKGSVKLPVALVAGASMVCYNFSSIAKLLGCGLA